jgi:hypothetical protein
MQVVDALVRADKDFDLGHSRAGGNQLGALTGPIDHLTAAGSISNGMTENQSFISYWNASQKTARFPGGAGSVFRRRAWRGQRGAA